MNIYLVMAKEYCSSSETTDTEVYEAYKDKEAALKAIDIYNHYSQMYSEWKDKEYDFIEANPNLSEQDAEMFYYEQNPISKECCLHGNRKYRLKEMQLL